MEKEVPPPESITSVNIGKPDYPPSEVYSSEPPPAYQRPKSASVQVAKIIAVTVILVSVVLGGCILASAYITANASCKHLEQELQLITESMDRFQPLQPEALVQEEPLQQNKAEPLEAEDKKSSNKNAQDSSQDSSSSQDSQSDDSDSSSSEDSEEEERIPVQIKLPLHIDFDDLAGAMLEKNQRSKMNCIVEKKRAEEVIDHQAKTLNLPFGVNLTTDPRLERVTGERIAIFCESGNMQRQAEPQQDQDEQTVMIQPIMIPIPPPQFHTHMSMQAAPIQQHQQPQQDQQLHPMETMRPPMPHPMIQIQQVGQGPMPPSPVLHHIAEQIIAQKLRQEAQRSQEEVQTNELRPEESEERHPIPLSVLQEVLQKVPIPEEVLSQINRLPNREVVIAVSQQQPEEAQQQDVRIVQHQRQSAQGMNGRQSYARGIPVNIPVPMMQQVAEQETSASDEDRVHYVHPRSIRSVEDFVPKQKRVKRCNCDCAC